MPQLNEQTIVRRLPHPIAAAWSRVAFAQTDADRLLRLVACYEIMLRTVTTLLLPDYFRGPADPNVEQELRKLERPSTGMWLGLVRSLIIHLGERDDPRPFLPEVRQWYFTAAGRPTPVARTLERIVRKRNDVMHDKAGVTPVQVQKSSAELLGEVRSVLTGMDWLLGYRLFRIITSRPTRQSTFNGKVQFLTGRDENEPEAAKWDVFLVPDSVYLTNPAGTELLEVDPFVQVIADEEGLERLYLIKQIPGFRQITLAHDATGKTITTAVSDERIPFDEWLARRPFDLHHHLKITNGVFRTNTPPVVRPGDKDFGPRFQLISELGRGGMAVVYEVRDHTVRQTFALKVLNRELSEDASYRERFRREAEKMSRVQGPSATECIVPMVDLGDLPTGQLYLKMPVMRQGSLNERIRRGEGCPEATVRVWAENALEALVQVHAEEIVHRDIKPSNFLLNDDGRVMLTDFGIALGPDDERLTRTLEQMGTVAYMAPEQIKLRTVTDKADIYGLAVVLHELLTGDLPEDGPGEGIDTPFGELIRGMGSKNPAARPSARDALAALRAPSAVPVAEKQPEPIAPVSTSPTPIPALRTGRVAAIHAADDAREHRSRTVLAWSMLGVLFLLNYIETALETWLRHEYRLGIETEQSLAAAVRWLERELDFAHHDGLGIVAAHVFSAFYFLAFPLIAFAAIAIFMMRRDSRSMVFFATASAIDYAISLPFYLFFPIPERWADPGSKAILLSDLITSQLIEVIRPFSGLNNCFPSFHVSGTLIVILCLYRVKAPFRHAVAFTGTAIILATFVLGIHWVPDIVAGIGAALISARLAERLLPRVLRSYSAGAAITSPAAAAAG